MYMYFIFSLDSSLIGKLSAELKLLMIISTKLMLL